MKKADVQSKGTTSYARLLLNAIWKNRMVYLLILPALIWYFVFTYMPMGGLSLAFKTYKAKLGIWGSPWVGLKNFESMFIDPSFLQSVLKTLYINFGRLLIEFPFAVILALILDEARIGRLKKPLQIVYTFPHFLSWIIIASILNNVLSYDGMVNTLIEMLGGTRIRFLSSESLFQPMLYITSIWKSAGWNTIIYLAAISGVDQDQYESAEIDGATRLQRVFHITLPNILPTIAIMFIMTAGKLLAQDFDQIFNLSNAAVSNVSETLGMYIYRITFASPPDFGFSVAVSLFRSIINLILLLLANQGSKWLSGTGLFA